MTESEIERIADEHNIDLPKARWLFEGRESREAQKQAVLARKMTASDLPGPGNEPPVGTRIRMASGRTFERTDPHHDFHWRDGGGWYRWEEVHRRALREGGRVLLTLEQDPVAELERQGQEQG